MCEKCEKNIKKLEGEVKVAQDNLVTGLYDRIFCKNNDSNDEDFAAVLVKLIRQTEEKLRSVNYKLANSYYWNYFSYKKRKKILETELLELRGELAEVEAEIELNQDRHALNDGIKLGNGNWDERTSNMYTTKTETTETYPLNACDHEFIDVYDYNESIPQDILDRCVSYDCTDVINKVPNILEAAKLISKKYILSYCKVCGYTINACTECKGRDEK